MHAVLAEIRTVLAWEGALCCFKTHKGVGALITIQLSTSKGRKGDLVYCH